MGSIIIISAPSGAGKTTLVNALVGELSDIIVSVSCTTRSPRVSEIEGKDYHFLSEDQFQKYVNEQQFLEHANVYDHCYGTLISNVEKNINSGKDVILEIDYQGALQVMKSWRGALVSVFILPPSQSELEKRLRNRGEDTNEVIIKRLDAAYRDIAHCEYYHHVIINEDLECALNQLKAVVLASRTRWQSYSNKNKERLDHLIKSFEKK